MLGNINFIERQVEAGGVKAIVLTATDYPYGNYQVLHCDETTKARMIEKLNREPSGRIEGRDDFGTIIIGGCVKLDISQENASAVAQAIIDACHQAAAWWHEHHPAPVDYSNLDIRLVEGNEIKTHPTYNGVEPVPIPQDYYEQWKREHLDHDTYSF